MKISLTVLSAFGLAAGSLMLAAPAQAITNPADNPRPITVKGDDGRTYTDGEDTLPGYDDVECSYIPGAWYDFDNNRVHYADGQSVSWTEWDRVAGYKSWLAKKNAAPAKSSTGAKAPATGSASKPAKQSSTKTTTSKPAATAKSTGAAKPASAGEKAAGASSGAAPTSPAQEEGAVSEVEGTTTATAEQSAAEQKDAAEPKGTEAEEAAQAGAAETVTDAEQPAAVEGTFASAERAEAAGDEGGSAAGLLILGALAAGAAALVGGWSFVGRRRKEAQL